MDFILHHQDAIFWALGLILPTLMNRLNWLTPNNPVDLFLIFVWKLLGKILGMDVSGHQIIYTRPAPTAQAVMTGTMLTGAPGAGVTKPERLPETQRDSGLAAAAEAMPGAGK